jgi:hypothetical protein
VEIVGDAKIKIKTKREELEKRRFLNLTYWPVLFMILKKLNDLNL